MMLDEILNNENAEVIVYKRINNKSLKILMKKPRDWSVDDKRTAVIWIHGGGWQRGEAEMFLPHMEYFSKRGAVAFSIEYTLAEQNGCTVEDCLQDCIDGVTYLKDKALSFGIDTEKFVVGGDSAGGHLANCIGTPGIYSFGKREKTTVNCVINCNGIIDMTMKWKSALYYNDDSHSISTEDWRNQYDRCRGLSPIFNITKNNSPMLILHGLEDRVVEPEEAMRYFYALKSQGVEVEIDLIPGVEHAFILFNYNLDNERVFKILQSVDRYLVSRGLLTTVLI